MLFFSLELFEFAQFSGTATCTLVHLCEYMYMRHPARLCCLLGSENDKMAVTDPQCRVYGLESLRVVDASIMPKVTTGNLNGKLVILKRVPISHEADQL